MFRKGAIGLALSALILCSSVAYAGCERSKTTGTILGAGAGGVVLGAVTHSPAGWIGGAALGGFAGHRIAANNCRDRHYYRHGYYDRDGHWHHYS